MPKKTPRNHKLTDHDFLQLSKTEGNARARIRLLMLHQLSQGHPIATVAENFGYNPRSVYTIRRKYWLHGITIVKELINCYKAKENKRTKYRYNADASLYVYA